MTATASSATKLRAALVRGLAERADPGRAGAMQRYMKSAMPFLGVGSPERRALERDVFAGHPLVDAATWRRAVGELWRKARFREERYAAVDLLIHRRYRPWLDLDALPLIEELVSTGAWWDFVDPVAGHAVGHLLREHPARMRRVLVAWAQADDLWKRRTAILAQLGFKHDTDTELLYACIEPSLGHTDFFLRKGIGWALRQYAWANPAEVRRKVAALGERLSPLSRREALKNIGRAEPRPGRPSRSGRLTARRAHESGSGRPSGSSARLGLKPRQRRAAKGRGT